MRRHELDLFSLVAGVLFLVVAAAHVVDELYADLDLDGRWVAPVVLVGLGAAGLAGLVRGGRRDEPAEPAPDRDDAP